MKIGNRIYFKGTTALSEPFIGFGKFLERNKYVAHTGIEDVDVDEIVLGDVSYLYRDEVKRLAVYTIFYGRMITSDQFHNILETKINALIEFGRIEMLNKD